MKMKKQDIVKRMCIVEFLNGIGVYPNRIYAGRYYHYSQVGRHKVSFRVDIRLNRWSLENTGACGKNIISLAKWLYDTQDINVIHYLLMATKLIVPASIEGTLSSFGKVRMTPSNDIHHDSVIAFLQSRGLTADVASRYFRETTVDIGGVQHYALVIPNDAGGRLITGQGIKEWIEPNGITTLHGKRHDGICYIFLTYLDMLSFCEIHHRAGLDEFVSTIDMVIVSSMPNVSALQKKIKDYSMVCCCLPRTHKGRHIYSLLFGAAPDRVIDCSDLYQSEGTLNRHLLNNKNDNEI